MDHQQGRDRRGGEGGEGEGEGEGGEGEGEEAGAPQNPEEVGSFPREEPVLLRWAGDGGPAERGPAAHPGPHPPHHHALLHL